MKNVVKLGVAILLTWTLIMMSTVLMAQSSFQQFVADVNVQTGIATNDYQSNVAKCQKLGVPTTTLWNLYLRGYKVSTSTEIPRVTQVEEVITPQSSDVIMGFEAPVDVEIPSLQVIEETVATEDTPQIATIPVQGDSTNVEVVIASVDTMQYVHTINNLTQIATEYEATIEKLENKIKLLYDVNTKHQEGDLIIVSKGYKKAKNLRTNKSISISEFDALFDKGLIKHNKNRQWIYKSPNSHTVKMGLGDGFIFIVVCLMLLLGGAKMVAKPKPSKDLLDYKEKVVKLGLEIQMLSKANSTLKKENETLHIKLNPHWVAPKKEKV